MITEEELRQYFLFIKNVKKFARGSSTIAICGIKFFYERTLNRQWTTLSLVRAAPEKKLPVITSGVRRGSGQTHKGPSTLGALCPGKISSSGRRAS